jgi:hypothetical protein
MKNHQKRRIKMIAFLIGIILGILINVYFYFMNKKDK